MSEIINDYVMNEIINDTVAILENCLYNGSISSENLYSWFIEEKTLIEGVLQSIIESIEPKKGPYYTVDTNVLLKK